MNPLEGLRVVVTRAAHQAEELARPLREQGAEPILLPVIAIAPPENTEPLRSAIHSDAYDWIIFTSANAVDVFAAELRAAGRECKARVATVGSATRKAAEASGFRVELMPEQYIAESLVDAFAVEDLSHVRILIPSAAVTRDAVAPALRSRGARVDVVPAYRTILPAEAAEQARRVFQLPYPDWVTFASSSAVTNLVRLVDTHVLRGVSIASIGLATSETVRAHGLLATAEAQVHTVSGLVGAIVACRYTSGHVP